MPIKYRTNQSEVPVGAVKCDMKVKQKFQLSYDEDGRKCLKPCGETNFYQQTQEALQDVLLKNVVDRFTRSGRLGELADNGAVKMSDFTGVPKDLLEANLMNLKAKQHFESLPVDIKREYNFSHVNYVRDIENRLKNYGEALAKASAEKQAEKKVEVTVDA